MPHGYWPTAFRQTLLSPQAVSKALHLLSSVPANGRDGPPLVEAIRRGQGKTNRYVIHDAS